nr:MAG TPA: hypothetical protein [Caudoviricetes sp.]DAY00939.1 MAG TPA: hypothetical protein [Caudoviricetes sp.]
MVWCDNQTLVFLFLIATIGHQLESHTRHIYGYFYKYYLL